MKRDFAGTLCGRPVPGSHRQMITLSTWTAEPHEEIIPLPVVRTSNCWWDVVATVQLCDH